MKKPLIMLFGKNGQVGYELSICLQSIGHVMAFDSKQADYTQPEKIIHLLQQYQPQIIVNAVAYTAVDKAETESELAFKVNAHTPLVLAEYAQKNGSLLVHYSTDFVFDGQADKAYLETDQTNPLSVYGLSKLAGDNAILESGCAALIFRTSWVYGSRGKNFLLTMLRLAHEREEMKVVSDQQGSPVWCRHIALVTEIALLRIMESSENMQGITEKFLGLFNLTANNYTSWFGFAQNILSLDPNKKEQICQQLIAIPSSEYPTPAVRPTWSVLDNSKLNKTFDLVVPSWQDQLKSCLS